MKKINPFMILSMLVLLATGCCCHSCTDHSCYTLADHYGLELLLIDDIRNDHCTRYCAHFTSDKKLELSAGRKFALPLAHDFLHMLCESKLHYNPNRLGLKIDFWDKNMNRPQKPYIAQITFSHGMFSYYQADPSTEALRLVLRESFSDAIKNSKYGRVDFSRKIWDEKETDKDLPPTWKNSWITPQD